MLTDLPLLTHSDHEGKVDLSEAVSEVDSSEDGGVCPRVGSETWPDAASEVHASAVDLVSLDSPRLIGLLQSCIVHEVVAEDVFLTSALVHFLALNARAQVHVGVEAFEVVDLQASESLVDLHAGQRVLAV